LPDVSLDLPEGEVFSLIVEESLIY
jgi:hypothetical protein